MSLPAIDATHGPSLESWVESANGHPHFPIQNLPFGIFSPGADMPRGGVAIGDFVLDLGSLADSGLLDGDSLAAAKAASRSALNAFLALGPAPRRALRRQVSALLARGAEDQARVARSLRPGTDCVMHLPAKVGDYTDFYAGIHHAMNVGKIFRPDNPLLPNYKHVPIAYHGRASTIAPSGTVVRRPIGQTTPAGGAAPSFGPVARLDYELEMGIWLSGGNPLGQPISICEARDHVAGLTLLNDWSARDLQAWEYQPLGPFLSKSFLTTVSPWLVTVEALAPFWTTQSARPAGDPAPLPYLWDEEDQRAGAISVDLEVAITTDAMRRSQMAPVVLGRVNASDLYWTMGQMITHHASNGCRLRSGDLLGTGTISGPGTQAFGSLLELSRGGAEPFSLPTGETRSFLEDGDEVSLSGKLHAEGFVPIGFGDCTGVIIAAK